MITSLTNSRVKQIVALQQRSATRRTEGKFVVEGRREILHCLEGGLEIAAFFHCPSIADDISDILAQAPAAEIIDVTALVYDKIAYRGGTEGLIAVVKTPHRTLQGLRLPDNPLVIVLESVEKPGNLGAVLRTADAAGVDAVIVCDPVTDIYNPNVIRGSIGAVFTVPTVTCTTDECVRFLKRRGMNILTAQLQDSRPYYDVDMTGPTAIVMGTESTGLTEAWREAASAHILIPMNGRLDSLNVAISASILVYEAVRQRFVR
ncbi:MAG: RNA methyltransferase [Muribaculaceae bacterium]|nr:RNA methyltransferase [Muribaculaceae bacterium]